MYDLTRFQLADMTRCGAELRAAGQDAESMEDAARAITGHLYQQLTDSDGRKCCALVRVFATLDYGDLDDELRAFGRALMSAHDLEANTKCLTLLATSGDEPSWNSRWGSAGHKAIPLPSEHVVDHVPMIAQLIRQLGLEVASVLRPDPRLLMEQDQQTYNVFFVREALDSPFIPAQREFVIPHAIRSVLGMGGVFPTGNIFAILLFTKVQIPRETAELFRTVALNAKIALLPFVLGPIFARSTAG